MDDLSEQIKNLGAEYDARLRQKADEFMEKRVTFCKSKEEVREALDLGKIAKFNFCSVDSQGVKCAEFIEKELQARVMGTRADINEKVNGKCLFCDKEAKHIVYAGKSY